jgi:hypothetical protein
MWEQATKVDERIVSKLLNDSYLKAAGPGGIAIWKIPIYNVKTIWLIHSE